jgi:hypothetical protein
MVVNLIIGGVIFGYAAWALVRFLNRSKQGKCAACHIQDSCTSQDKCQTTIIKK